MQSPSFSGAAPLHVAVIMDGNGRWATRRRRPRAAGHRAGAQAARATIEAAPALGVTTLTLFALSSDNFGRPAGEVAALLRLLAEFLERETDRLAARGVRLELIGRRDRLGAALNAAVARAERRTAGGRALDLRVAVDYSARAEILRAAATVARAAPHGPPDAHPEVPNGRATAPPPAGPTPFGRWPDVDLLVRSGGERRLSDFLLWECAYAELWFTDRLWPDFTRHDLAEAVAAYRQRDRRFGLIPGSPAA